MFTGVVNYQGLLSFKITLQINPAFGTLSVINVTQPADSNDPLITDYPALVAAREAGDDARAAAATEPETTEAETTEETTAAP